ncbi:acyltransferase family protein [Kitasatospora sp. NPDC059571]|uniref:acyltransferase family protein n=1 Tax=Kitasatospora sp. NPDC059571 TaxID=3346871 RepID=UPI0036A3DE59
MRAARGSTIVPGQSRYAVEVPELRSPEPGPGGSGGRAPRYDAVDGLRGVAILSVLLYHTNWFQNGLFGVDAFFVLSGFLVTLLLVRELDRSGRIALGRFYRRRAKRLIPGLLITLVAVLALALLFSPLREARQFRPEALAALFQAANWAQLLRGGSYWDHFASIDPFSAMWSLSITEQFYVVWPLLLLLVYVVCRRSLAATGTVTFLLFGAAAAVAPLMWDGSNSDRLYLGTESRAVGFAAGAAAAFVVHLRHRRSAAAGREGGSAAATVLLNLLGVGCLAGVVWLSIEVSTYHTPWLYAKGGLAAVAALVAVLAATLCHDRGPLAKVLSFHPLVVTGRISYSLYLLHLPVYWLLQQHVDDTTPATLLGIGGAITWVLAWFLHRFTEGIRLRDWRVGRALPLLTAGALLVGAGSWYLPQVIEYRMRPAGKPVVLTLGDSFAEDLAAALYQEGGRYAVVDGGISGCGVFGPEKVRGTSQVEFPVSAECRDQASGWAASLADAHPAVTVLHLGWDAAEQYVDGRWISPCDDAYRARYLARLKDAVDLVHRDAPDTRILLMNERTQNGAINYKWGSCYNRHIEDFVNSTGGQVQLLDLEAFLCPKGVCRWTDDGGASLYPVNDGVHLAPAGKRLVAPWLQDRIAEALAGPAAPAASDDPAPPSPSSAASPSASPSASPTAGKSAQPSRSPRPKSTSPRPSGSHGTSPKPTGQHT